MSLAWRKLIRFEADDGRILRGESISQDNAPIDLGLVTAGNRIQAKVLVGEDIYDTTGTTHLTNETVTVAKILGPLTPADVPIIRCIGLNYAKHIKEAGRSPPPFPSIFIKPNTTISGHNEAAVIPWIAQDDQAGYESELRLVVGKDAKDVPREKALEYVAAYTAGNDISSRKLQRDPAYAGKIPQWCFSKGFDTFAPLGPCLVAAVEIPDPTKLHLRTIVDGEGTTVQKSSVIMTGTPGGVGAGMNPPKYLQPGTQMDVEISQIGKLRSIVTFAK